MGVSADAGSFRVKTQQTFDGQRRLVDLVVWCLDQGKSEVATVFVEAKFNPSRDPAAHWFSEGQASRQRGALGRQPGRAKRLIGIASTSDLHGTRGDEARALYDELLGWDAIAER